MTLVVKGGTEIRQTKEIECRSNVSHFFCELAGGGRCFGNQVQLGNEMEEPFVPPLPPPLPRPLRTTLMKMLSTTTTTTIMMESVMNLYRHRPPKAREGEPKKSVEKKTHHRPRRHYHHYHQHRRHHHQYRYHAPFSERHSSAGVSKRKIEKEIAQKNRPVRLQSIGSVQPTTATATATSTTATTR